MKDRKNIKYKMIMMKMLLICIIMDVIDINSIIYHIK